MTETDVHLETFRYADASIHMAQAHLSSYSGPIKSTNRGNALKLQMLGLIFCISIFLLTNDVTIIRQPAFELLGG